MLIKLDRLTFWRPERPDGVERRVGLAISLNRGLVVAILLFGLAVPHSIAAAQIAFLSGLVFWCGRELVTRRNCQAASWLDNALFWFVALTLLSSFLSFAPAISLLKSKTLGLFLILHLILGNLTRRGAIVLAGCLILSSLVGVGYSLGEKIRGRGMVIGYVDESSPLAGSGLRPGDVIWMVARERVESPAEMAAVIARHQVGEVLSVEALHAGDPLPVTLTVTESLRGSVEALGIRADGRTRRFRVSGLTRQFITFAEQMQLLGLFSFGMLLVWVGRAGARQRLVLAVGIAFPLFVAALLLTATRSVIVSFIGALVLITLRCGGRLAVALVLAGAVLIGAVGVRAVVSSRRELAVRFNDDSTRQRIGYMKAGLRVIPRHPLLGVGMDSHKIFWEEWGFPGRYVTHTHSTPIQIALDRGLPALGCLLWMGMATWAHFRRRREEALDDGDLVAAGLATGALAALLGFSLSALTNYNFGDSESLMQLLAILGAAGAGQRRADLPAPMIN